MATNLDNLKQLFLTILCNYLDYLRLSYLRLSQSTIWDNPCQLSHTIKDDLRIYESFIPDFLRQLFKTSCQSIFLTYIVTKYQTTIEQHNNNINYKTISKQLGFFIVISLVSGKSQANVNNFLGIFQTYLLHIRSIFQAYLRQIPL